MTEEQWLSCADPAAMLEFLRAAGRASDRKLRLFAVACSRRAWGRIDALGRGAVEVAEAFADGFTGPEELRAARHACKLAGASAAWYAAASSPAIAARNAAFSAQTGSHFPLEGAAQAALLRDVIGNPFRTPAVGPAGLTTGVVALAESAYEDRILPEGHLDQYRLALMAVALEEAGCANADILAHLRDPGPHVRGCWVLDLILAKDR